MLPNSTPGFGLKSSKNSVSIRNMATSPGDGVSKSFRRIRCGIHKVRSPCEDEDFLNPDK